MRTHKYRAWDGQQMRPSVAVIDGMAAVWQNPDEDSGTITLELPFGGRKKYYAEWASLVPHPDWILLQYTGLKDKNGVEIYEGDLLRFPAKDSYEERTYNCFEVFYHNNDCTPEVNVGFCMSRMFPQGWSGGGQGFRFIPRHVANMEVIGNIYENPELLEK